MNTEELERSLRAEFDEHIKKVLNEAREDVAALQKNVEAELDKHRSQMDEAFRALTERLDAPSNLDQVFTESVIEHLKLARDEGARVTAVAMGEAEKLNSDAVVADDGYSKLRDAIDDIRTKTTQAAVLRSLVDAASNFAPRGAFFIVRNDHLIGWKVFGADVDEDTVRSVHFPLSSDTLLSHAVNSLSARSGFADSASENSTFQGPLGFDSPQSMVAVPLAARGRGVAVLYADGGPENSPVNAEALEALVSVAGLTVEMLAGAAEKSVEQAHQTPASTVEERLPEAVSDSEEAPQTQDYPIEAPEPEVVADESEYSGIVAVEEETVPEPEPEVEVEPVQEVSVDEIQPASGFEFSQSDYSKVPSEEPVVEDEVVVEEEAVEEVIPAAEHVPVAEPEQTRQSYRTVDLPIEVSEDERRSHSDARRFARLLVSEIKLYNEQKVVQGRESGDIYEVLKDAIDRSREMYDKRVQPDVASKFDYFHYELVNNLAEGSEEKLGMANLAVQS